MNKDEKRALSRKRLMDNKAYQTMNGLTRYMDRYYIDALIGIIPGWVMPLPCSALFRSSISRRESSRASL
jgi:hypothetical protein